MAAPGTKVYLGFGPASGVAPIAQPPRFGTVLSEDENDNSLVLWETGEVTDSSIADGTLDVVTAPTNDARDTYLYQVVRFNVAGLSQEYTAQVVDVFTENALVVRLILKSLKGNLWFRAVPADVVLVGTVGVPQ